MAARGAEEWSLWCACCQPFAHAAASSLLTARFLCLPDRLLAQTAIEPGVATVFRELVRAGADARVAWCTVDDEQLSGGFGRAASLFADTVLLGVQAAGSQHVLLNPPDSFLLAPNDRLIGITRLGERLAGGCWQRRQRRAEP